MLWRKFTFPDLSMLAPRYTGRGTLDGVWMFAEVKTLSLRGILSGLTPLSLPQLLVLPWDQARSQLPCQVPHSIWSPQDLVSNFMSFSQSD